MLNKIWSWDLITQISGKMNGYPVSFVWKLFFQTHANIYSLVEKYLVLRQNVIKIITSSRHYRYYNKVITWWHHQLEPHFPRYWPFLQGIHRSPVNFTHKGQWRGALMFSLICAWINNWVVNREADDLRRHRGHYDVNVMIFVILMFWAWYTRVMFLSYMHASFYTVVLCVVLTHLPLDKLAAVSQTTYSDAFFNESFVDWNSPEVFS